MSDVESAIYEASVVPSNWPLVLAVIAEKAGARGGVLFSVTNHGAEWTASPNLQESMAEFVSGGWSANNTRMDRGLRQGLHLQPRFVTETEYDPTGEIYKDAIYQQYFIPQGLGQSAGTIAPLPHGDMLCFSFERAIDLGPFNPEERAVLDGFRPHLMRAAMLTARLGVERIRSSVETLARLGFPAAAVTSDGRVILANMLFSESDLWTTRGNDRLALLDPAANELMRVALQYLDQEKSVRSIPCRQMDGPARHAVHILPVRKDARDIFTRAAAIVIATAVRSPAGDPAILQTLFDLTYAEAVVARRIAAGEDVKAIASTSGRSVATIRNQLRSVLMKTGCSRQAQLAVMLNGLAPPNVRPID